jgi:hypothetical protein
MCFGSSTTKPLRGSISVRRPFCKSWDIEGRCSEEVYLESEKRCWSRTCITFRRPRQARDGLGRQMQDLLQLIAQRLALTNCLAPEAGREAADRIALQHGSPRQASAGRASISHDVGHELGPALAPKMWSPWRCRHRRPGGILPLHVA